LFTDWIGQEKESAYKVRSTRFSLGRASRERHDMTHEQEPLFYTADEVATKVAEAQLLTDLRVQTAQDNISHRISVSLVETLRNEVANADLDKAIAQDIYNAMQVAYGWNDASLTVNQYLVTVTLDGSEIAEVEVEAEDEDEACDLVRDDFVLYDADVTLTFRDGHGNEHTHEVCGVEHEMYEYQDSLEFTAEEQ
jgi:hypothetical protein